ncbi:MAG: hypothetical protein H7287_06450 [Thermoleophilia bacterium]|nr:hypothetical protein [Thermoleophilia bacterium]
MSAIDRLAVIGVQMTKPARASAQALAMALDELPTQLGAGLERTAVARSLTHARAGLDALPVMDASMFNDNVRGRLTQAVRALELTLDQSPMTSKQVPSGVHHFVAFAQQQAAWTIDMLAIGAR